MLSPAAIGGVNTFVFYFALPALIFNLLATSTRGEILNLPFMGAYLSVALSVFAVVAILGRLIFSVKLGESAMQGAAAVLGNTGYMGLPLVAAAFGQEAAIPLLLGVALETTILIPLTIIIIELGRGAGKGWTKLLSAVAGSLIRNPLVMAIFVGALVSGFTLPLPAPVAEFSDLLGSAAGPCALFALGATLVGRPLVAGISETSYMSACKLLVHPAVMWLAMTQIVAVDPLWATAAVLGAALPVAANVFIVARQYDTYLERVSSAILLSTAVSILTVSALLVILPHG